MPPRVVHPLLFAAAPVVFLYSNNLDKYAPTVVGPPLLWSLLGAAVAWIALGAALRSASRGAVATSFLVLLFFSFGRVQEALLESGWSFLGLDTAPERPLLVIWVVLLAAAWWLVERMPRNLGPWHGGLHVMGVALVLMPLWTILRYEPGGGAVWAGRSDRQNFVQLPAELPDHPPDIYYILLDGYARADVLQQVHGYDNSEFVEFLRSRDFLVCDNSLANYGQTALSLASTLQLRYVQDLFERLPVGSRDRKPLIEMSRKNQVFAALRRAGYRLAGFDTETTYLDPEGLDDFFVVGSTVNAFESGVLNTTPIPAVRSLLAQSTGEDRGSQYDEHRRKLLHALDTLGSLGHLRSPHFVYAHLVAPHPPFVFDARGAHVAPNRPFSFLERAARVGYAEGYLEQLSYVTQRIMETIDGILESSGGEAVIVLHSDHGPASLWLDHWASRRSWATQDVSILRERMAILNAYYLPGSGPPRPQDDMSPVNTFRLIFDRYLGTDLGLLEDRSYFSTYDEPYAFTDVTEALAP